MVSKLQHDLIIGSLLGDGSLHLSNNSQNPFFRIVHNKEQGKYCNMKFDIIKGLCNIEKLKYYNGNPTLYTKRLPLFHKYRNMSIEDKLNQLNENSLAIWYLDDGYYNYKIDKGYSCALSMARFTINELEYCVEVLKSKFAIEVSINKNKNRKNGHQGIRINNKKNRSKLFDIILNSDFGYIAKDSMIYKIGE